MADHRTLSDEELTLLVRERAPDAFAELSARYAGLVRLKASQFTGPAAPEREDLLQEGFLGLYAAAVSYDKERGASFRTYAGTCVYNRMVAAARRHGGSKNRALNESLSLESEAASLPASDGPEDLLELRDQVQSLLKRLDGLLSPLERRALLLYLSGYRREEIETRFGMPLKTYDNALYRIRAKLKKG